MALTRTQTVVASACVLLLAIATAITVSVVAGSSRPDESEPKVPSDPTPAPSASSADCVDPTITVSTGAELQQALDAAAPGDAIQLESGTFFGNFVATAKGTAEQPIRLCGSIDSVLDGGGTNKGYVLHLDGVSYWQIEGFTVSNGQKGVMADGTTNTTIAHLTVTTIGDEGIHLRRFSTDNLVSSNHVTDTGLRKQKFGEGIYIGSAESNWCDISGCEPDRSDRNVVESNVIERTTSESVDIKEGTSNGVLRANNFDGALINAADSWVDVKGNDWLVENNVGVNSPQDGFQVHEILDGWGTGNIFRGNLATVNGSGLGFSLTPVRDNVVSCTNSVSAAGEGFSNTDCSG